MNNPLMTFENKLKMARTVAEVNQALQEYLAEHGITTFSFTYYSHYLNALNKLKYDHASANFKAWHAHYLSENYEEIDSTLEAVYLKSLPEFWDLKEQLKNATSEREKQMRLDSIEFGVEKGISIPIHGPHEDFANFLVAQRKGETCLDHWQKIQYELFAAAYFYYAYLHKQLLKIQEPSEKHQLNKRDIQCLTLIAKQYTVPMMAKTLNITERTVNYHIQRLNKKLGTKNKHQSVAKALQSGIIKL